MPPDLAVPVGAVSDVAGKLPPLADAFATADLRSSFALEGTVDKNPNRGGSCDG